jgi:hypothetical protein
MAPAEPMVPLHPLARPRWKRQRHRPTGLRIRRLHDDLLVGVALGDQV